MGPTQDTGSCHFSAKCLVQPRNRAEVPFKFSCTLKCFVEYIISCGKRSCILQRCTIHSAMSPVELGGCQFRYRCLREAEGRRFSGLMALNVQTLQIRGELAEMLVLRVFFLVTPRDRHRPSPREKHSTLTNSIFQSIKVPTHPSPRRPRLSDGGRWRSSLRSSLRSWLQKDEHGYLRTCAYVQRPSLILGLSKYAGKSRGNTGVS